MVTNYDTFDSCKYEQAKKEATRKANQYLKTEGYKLAKVHCSRGTFHLTNGYQYFLDAAQLLNKVTGFDFTRLNPFMARLNKEQFQLSNLTQ